MLSKKGEAAGKPLAESGDLILGVLSVIVIVGVVVLLFSGDSIEELVCKISVHMADQTHGVLPIICRTFDQVVDESQTSRVKFEIADHMRRCWSMWGEGDLNPVGKNIFPGDKFKCYKCYRLQFPEYEEELSYNEVRDYLEDSADPGVDIPLAMSTRTGQVTLLQMDGILSKEELKELLALGKKASEKIKEVQVKALLDKFSGKE